MSWRRSWVRTPPGSAARPRYWPPGCRQPSCPRRPGGRGPGRPGAAQDDCDERTRRLQRADGADAGRCPRCHPLAAEHAASSRPGRGLRHRPSSADAAARDARVNTGRRSTGGSPLALPVPSTHPVTTSGGFDDDRSARHRRRGGARTPGLCCPPSPARPSGRAGRSGHQPPHGPPRPRRAAVRDYDPGPGMRAARVIELAARRMARDYIKAARQDAMSWHQSAPRSISPPAEQRRHDRRRRVRLCRR